MTVFDLDILLYLDFFDDSGSVRAVAWFYHQGHGCAGGHLVDIASDSRHVDRAVAATGASAIDSET